MARFPVMLQPGESIIRRNLIGAIDARGKQQRRPAQPMPGLDLACRSDRDGGPLPDRG